MKHLISFFLLIICSLTGFAQVKESALEPPEGNKLSLRVFAKGTQIYSCNRDSMDTAKYSWVLVTPQASLYSDSSYTHLVGKHYFGKQKNPTWEYNDGSKVSGNKLKQLDAPDGRAIPWLLLKSVETSGKGVLTSTTFIQRINTKGGKAPVADKAHKGQIIKVPYTAEYLFYSKE